MAVSLGPSGLTLDNITIPDDAGGTVLQVKHVLKTDVTTGGSSSFTDYPSMSITITPSSASSKFLIMFNCAVTMYDYTVQIRLTRNGNAFGRGNSSNNRTRTTAGQMQPDTDQNHQAAKLTACVLDSPSTTDAITYKLQYKTQDGVTAYFNRSGNDANNGNWSHRTTSDFTVMEIAG